MLQNSTQFVAILPKFVLVKMFLLFVKMPQIPLNYACILFFEQCCVKFSLEVILITIST